MVRGFNAIVTTPRNCLNWRGKKRKKKKKQQKQVTLFKRFLCDILINQVVIVTYNTFTQLDIPTQGLPSWLV